MVTAAEFEENPISFSWIKQLGDPLVVGGGHAVVWWRHEYSDVQPVTLREEERVALKVVLRQDPMPKQWTMRGALGGP